VEQRHPLGEVPIPLRAAWKVIPLLVLLLLPAQGDEFLEKLDFYYPRYDWNGAISEVLKDPERARSQIPNIRALAQESERQRAFDLTFYADFIERVLHVHAGDPPPLKERDWKGTPIAGPPEENDPRAEAKRARRLWDQAALATEVGAYGMGKRWLGEAVTASHRIAWARKPVPEDLVQLQKRYRLYLMGMAKWGFVYPRSNDYVLTTELAEGSPEAAQLGLMAFVMAGRWTNDSDTIDGNLEKLQNFRSPDLAFAVESFQAERKLYQEDLQWDDFLSLYKNSWKKLSTISKPADDPLLRVLKRRWNAEAMDFWIEELNRRVGESGRPETQALLAETLKRAAESGFEWLAVDHLLEKADSARRGGNLALARSLVAEAAAQLHNLSEETKRPEKQFWQLALKVKYSPRPGETRLGFYRCAVRKAKLSNLLAQSGTLSPQEMEQAEGHLKFVLFSVQQIDSRLWPGPLLAEYAVMALRQNASTYKPVEEILTTTELSLILAHDNPLARTDVLVSRGRLLEATGDTDQARDSFSQAVKSVERYLTDSGASWESATRVRGRAREAYQGLARLLLESGKNEQALEVLAKLAQVETRGVMQTALLRGGGDDVSSGLQKAALLEQKTRALKKQEAQTKLSSAVTRGQDLEAVGELLADTRARYYATVKQLQTDEPNFTRLAVRPVNFARIQSVIPEDTTVVQYFPTESQLYIFVVSREQLKVRSVAVGKQKLEELLFAALGGLANPSAQLRSSGNWSHPGVRELKTSLHDLYGVLIKPVRDDLQERPVIAVIPTGLLSYLPIATLITDPEGDTPRFLVQDYQTVTVLKAVDLDGLLSPPPAGEGSLIGVGNPDGTLKAAELEVAGIKEIFPAAKLLTTGEATAKSLRDLFLTEPSYVHLATHGVINSAEPLESYLVMADGPLTLSEITNLQMGSPELVTLSACQTAVGEQSVDPGQDLTTLAEAFWFAGGRSLVASLWAVDDQSTKDLMVEFYRGLQAGMSKAEALQTAQLKLLAQKGTALPYQWAPFTLIGDWR